MLCNPRAVLLPGGRWGTEGRFPFPFHRPRGSVPVRTFAWLSSWGRLRTPSKELKWCTSWCSPYIPFWCCRQGKTTELGDASPGAPSRARTVAAVQGAGPG